MFTGIVEELGEVVDVTLLTDAVRITVAGPLVTSDAGHGDSIAVNGVCLTVVEVRDGTFTADVMLETLRRSSLAAVQPGDRVNLERAAALGHRLGGHLVQGHVDGTGRILGWQPAEHWELVRVSLPAELSRYVVHKGSIAVDGVSLTVADLTPDSFTVSLIPTTLRLTTLGRRRVGDDVNLEVDVLAKYVERLAAPHLAHQTTDPTSSGAAPPPAAPPPAASSPAAPAPPTAAPAPSPAVPAPPPAAPADSASPVAAPSAAAPRPPSTEGENAGVGSSDT